MSTSIPNQPPYTPSAGNESAEAKFPTGDDAVARDTASVSADDVAAADRDMMRRVVQAAHEAVDRLADKAIPAVERMRAGVNEASDRLHERAAQAGELKDEWTESLRDTVRRHPLASLATALAVGVILSRLNSNDR